MHGAVVPGLTAMAPDFPASRLVETNGISLAVHEAGEGTRVEFRLPLLAAADGELIAQLTRAPEVFQAFGIPVYAAPGYEADDIIATLSRRAVEAGGDVTIISSDKDLMQLVVDGQIELLDPVDEERAPLREEQREARVPRHMRGIGLDLREVRVERRIEHPVRARAPLDLGTERGFALASRGQAVGALALDGKKFEYNTNARLYRALELKLFEDQRDTIKLKNLVSSVVDDETQQKIDIVKQRLIKHFGYNETSATDVLNYVASIFARGDTKKKE